MVTEKRSGLYTEAMKLRETLLARPLHQVSDAQSALEDYEREYRRLEAEYPEEFARKDLRTRKVFRDLKANLRVAIAEATIEGKRSINRVLPRLG
jgi:hypothetical protein